MLTIYNVNTSYQLSVISSQFQTTDNGTRNKEPRAKNQDERTRSKEQRLLGMILLSYFLPQTSYLRQQITDISYQLSGWVR